MRHIYLKRAIITGTLWLSIWIILFQPFFSPLWYLVPGHILGIMTGKIVFGAVVDFTGLTIPIPWVWLFIIYSILTAVSMVFAPLYCAWNLFKHYRGT